MATRMSTQLTAGHDLLRVEPVDKRVRIRLGDATICDTTSAVLVWEPRRVVPQYAVPVADLAADLVPGPDALPDPGKPALSPVDAFGVHTAPGTPLTVRAGDTERPGAAFRSADPDLDGLVVLDFAAFDGWVEEDEPLVSHPQDPFHAIGIRRGARHVRISLGGHVLADSHRPTMVFETSIPVRHYLPEEDVDASVLVPSDTATACAYKGWASYRTAVLPGHTEADVCWTYPDPLPEATRLAGLVCFFAERVDTEIDGVAIPRPVTLWSPGNRQA
jgi:uncharacterized protein (DUF427 family)